MYHPRTNQKNLAGGRFQLIVLVILMVILVLLGSEGDPWGDGLVMYHPRRRLGQGKLEELNR